MTSEQFNILENEIHSAKIELDSSFLKLLSQAEDITKEMLSKTHLAGTNFFSKFETFVTSVSSEYESLSKTQVEDILTSIENILEYSIEYWNTIRDLSQNLSNVTYQPQNNFLRTSQVVLKTYRKDKALKIKKEFESNNIPIEGFKSKERYKLTSLKIDWVSLIFGSVLLLITGIIIFIVTVNNGLEYWLVRILGSLGVALIFTGLGKNSIQAKINLSGFAITAFGTIAIFLILYLLNPADVPKF